MALNNKKKRHDNPTNVPFNWPHFGSEETANIKKTQNLGQLSGDGFFTSACNLWLEKTLKAKKVLLTHSCTAALDMMGILSNVGLGDEVIMPSFTFASTANAFVLRGATPVFVDIRSDDLNINEDLIETAITKRTKAITVVHYAGVTCEMDTINKIAKKHKLLVFEDAAQALLARYKKSFSGTLGDLGAFSFHETKNVISGEGGALIINNPVFSERAETIRDSGTNRNAFLRRQVDKYSWVDMGSSYLPGELTAAFLLAQLNKASKINRKRRRIWEFYFKNLAGLEKRGLIRRPIIPNEVEHNGHIFYLLVRDFETRHKLIHFLKEKGIFSVFHYVPLHSSPAGLRYGKFIGSMQITNDYSLRLLRLPLYYDMSISQADLVVNEINNFYRNV